MTETAGISWWTRISMEFVPDNNPAQNSIVCIESNIRSP